MPRGRQKKTEVSANNIFDFIIIKGQNGCWTWNFVFGHSTPDGYQMYQHQLVHRRVYVLFKGQIPVGKELHHKCKNRKCVNPEHLEATTRQEHPDGGHATWKNKTHCPHGHEYTFENTKVYNGSRFCITCDKIHNEKRKLKRSLTQLKQITKSRR